MEHRCTGRQRSSWALELAGDKTAAVRGQGAATASGGCVPVRCNRGHDGKRGSPRLAIQLSRSRRPETSTQLTSRANRHDNNHILAGPAAENDAGPAKIRGRFGGTGAPATVRTLTDRSRHFDAEDVAKKASDCISRALTAHRWRCPTRDSGAAFLALL